MNSNSEPALPGCTRGAQRAHTQIHTRRADNLEGRGLAGLGGSVNRWKEPLLGLGCLGLCGQHPRGRWRRRQQCGEEGGV